MSFESQVNSSDPVVSEAAKMMQMYSEQLKKGDISQEEYKDLAQSVLNHQRVMEIVSDMKRCNEIFKAFQEMMQIASVIGQFAPGLVSKL